MSQSLVKNLIHLDYSAKHRRSLNTRSTNGMSGIDLFGPFRAMGMVVFRFPGRCPGLIC